MCGLAGRYRADGLTPAPGWAARADALLAHRGPDGAGHWQDWCCELIHRRLALQDLSPTGAQPMPNEDGSIQVVFNGEIYNHAALRAELRQRGHVFRGTSDTEVLVHLYEEAGEPFVGRLRGIFAFALYDAPRGLLLLARDRFGVKPLFVAGPSRTGEWLFASEMKALLAHPDLVPQLDRQACYDFLGLGFVPEPATGFANIWALEPGTLLSVDADHIRQRRFAYVEARPSLYSTLEERREEAAARLVAAVERQSRADVPVAALLSGGIDSSLVVAARARGGLGPPESFSMGFPGTSADESDAATAVAAHCAASHTLLDAREEALNTDAFLDLVRHFDQPFADPSLVPTFWVSRAIREHGVVCALSGDGGDEAFGGYPRIWQAQRARQLARAPRWMRQLGGWAGGALTPVTRDAGRLLVRATALANDAARDTAALIAGFSSYLSEPQKAALVRPDARAGLEPAARLFDGYAPSVAPDGEEVSRRLTETMFRVTLPGDMLRKVDMMSMYVGLEVRVPMLDEELVGVGLGLPHRLKSDGRRGKLVLRAIADQWLPRRVARLPKRGFSLPLEALAPRGLSVALRDLLLAPGARTAAFIARGEVEAWIRHFDAPAAVRSDGALSRGGLQQRLFTMLSLEMWMRDHRLTW